MRPAAGCNQDGAPAVEVVDRATWLAIPRLQTVGMLQREEGSARLLHRAPELAADAADLAPDATLHALAA